MYSFDVWEAQNCVATTMSTQSGEGWVIACYDLTTGTAKTLREDRSEKHLFGLHILPNGSPTCMATIQESNGEPCVRLFDANSIRPISKWKSNRTASIIDHDPLNPNVFFAMEHDRVVMYDKNVKNEVRVFTGLETMVDMSVPPVPGNLLIASNTSECLIWDVGTTRTLHSFKTVAGKASSLYANLAVVSYRDGIKVYDLSEPSSDEPTKTLDLSNQSFINLAVLPSNIVVYTNCSMWATTRFEE